MTAVATAHPGPGFLSGPGIEIAAWIAFLQTGRNTARRGERRAIHQARAAGDVTGEPGDMAVQAQASHEDSGLLQAIGAGDERALRLFMDRHLDRIHALALRFTGNAADAEDIAQEAMLRVWRAAAGWTPGGARPSTWLHRIVMNLCIDHARRARLRAFLPFGDRDPPDPAPDPEAVAAGRDSLARVADAVRALPARQRAALVLSVTGGQSNGEIAEALGMTTGAVEQALFRARKTLRDRFDGQL